MKSFNEEAKRLDDGYKTGVFGCMLNEREKSLAIENDCDCFGAGVVRIHWYLTRSENRHPVIKVEYHFPTFANRRHYFGNGLYGRKKKWECTTRSNVFPFTSDGLKAAIAFAESL